MKRRGFLARIVAALGVGAVGPGLVSARQKQDSPPPAPPCQTMWPDKPSMWCRECQPPCPRCGGSGEIIVEKPQAAGIRALVEGSYIPVPYGAVYESHPCPECQPKPCSRCGGEGEIPVMGLHGDKWREFREKGVWTRYSVPAPIETFPCPQCSLKYLHNFTYPGHRAPDFLP